MSILNHFALDKPRKTQVDVLNWIEKNVDKKYIFCELPIGSGKSAIAVTLANYISERKNDKSSFILTPQKILQTQYEKSFMTDDKRYFSTLYGKSNYQCKNKRTTCEIGSRISPKCPSCPHKSAVGTASKSDNVVMNYALALRSFKHTEVFKKRNLLVMDECHQLESILTDYNNVVVSKATCDKYKIKWNKSTDLVESKDWISNVYYPVMKEESRKLSEECEPLLEEHYRPSSLEINKILLSFQMEEHIELLANFNAMDDDELIDNFIFVSEQNSFKFKYLYGDYNFHNILEPMASQFLFLSSTIFDYKEFCKNLKIPLSQTCFISAESEFDPENRPVIFNPIMKMSYGWDNPTNGDNRASMIETINDIMIDHKNDKGIIHTGSFAVAQWLVRELSGSTHEILHHNPGSNTERDKIIEYFMKLDKPAILISPSITEGLDLVDDCARFAIFAKIPFGQLTDTWIKARMDISQKWYQLRALTDVIQGGGRIVRSSDDYGVVYILDSSFKYLYSNTKQYLPNWWKEAYSEV
jgi:ATP-dependent DNA helicase DinG